VLEMPAEKRYVRRCSNIALSFDVFTNCRYTLLHDNLHGGIMPKKVLVTSSAFLLLFSCIALAQNAAQKGIVKPAELKTLIPPNYFFAGKTPTVQLRNSAGVRLADEKLVLAALVDTAGYSTAIQEKYQGLFITESAIKIEDSELKPGAYGFGFTQGKFLIMDVGANDVLSVGAHHDDNLQRAVPLKIVEQDGSYRLYAGKNFVTIKQ
jgi:hypothetical protein